MNPGRKALARLAAAVAAALLFACAAPRDPWGLDVSRGREPAPLAVPDSMQADLAVAPAEPGALPFSARLYARPRKAYRLDAFGFTAAALASYRWENGTWLFVRHDEKRYLRGVGDGLAVEAASFNLPDVHAVLGFTWGELLPGFPGVPEAGSPDGAVRWTHAGQPWEAVFDPVTGTCREVRSPGMRIRYRGFRLRDGRALPDEAEIFVDGQRAATLRLKAAVRDPAWKRSPFQLVVPPGYTALEP